MEQNRKVVIVLVGCAPFVVLPATLAFFWLSVCHQAGGHMDQCRLLAATFFEGFSIVRPFDKLLAVSMRIGHSLIYHHVSEILVRGIAHVLSMDAAVMLAECSGRGRVIDSADLHILTVNLRVTERHQAALHGLISLLVVVSGIKTFVQHNVIHHPHYIANGDVLLVLQYRSVDADAVGIDCREYVNAGLRHWLCLAMNADIVPDAKRPLRERPWCSLAIDYGRRSHCN
ncbi:hypothetical protein D3C85_274650 [compost metagenome]